MTKLVGQYYSCDLHKLIFKVRCTKDLIVWRRRIRLIGMGTVATVWTSITINR